jgi:hypothetical protein
MVCYELQFIISRLDLMKLSPTLSTGTGSPFICSFSLFALCKVGLLFADSLAISSC